MAKVKKLSKKIIALIVCACIILALAITAGGMQIAFVLTDKDTVWTPDYTKEDIEPLINRTLNEGYILTEEDYAFLYKQTGLTKIGVDRALQSTYGKQRLISIHNGYFDTYEVLNQQFCPYICTDSLNKHMTAIYTEDGDILVTSSTHLSGWRMGHAGIVAGSSVIQATQVGAKSMRGSVADFTDRLNFMILRVKDEYCDAQTKKKVAEFADSELVGIPYDPTTGVFTNKNNIGKTQCAHLVWYAYNQFGINLDSNGGLVVTPRDIANSPYVELVQVFGFDNAKLWK